ncbi:unnamed protein product [Heterobilharzia americana]|nr:unnamed protein product [Heterobilharzia americana]
MGVDKTSKDKMVTSVRKAKNCDHKKVICRDDFNNKNKHLTLPKRISEKGDCRKQSKDNLSSKPSNQPIIKPKRSKSMPSNGARRNGFLNNEEERELFAKQRSVIYRLNEIMRKSELANYEAFMNLSHTVDDTNTTG